MKILAYPNSSGSRFWRLEDPFKYLRQLGHEADISDEPITDQAAKWADVIVLQGCVDKQGIALLRAYQSIFGKMKIVVDCDDYIIPSDDNPNKITHEINNYAEIVRITMGIADMVTTTTDHLKNVLKQFNDNVVVLPNYMDMERWDLTPKHFNETKRIRIGWAGSFTHLNDLKMIVEPLIRIKKEFPQVDYIFMGDPRIADEFPFQVEVRDAVSFAEWPLVLHNLRLDIGIAPLIDNEFNRCKSNIKSLEYSIAQIPGVYSPTVYQRQGFEPKFGMVADDMDHWYRSIKHLIIYPQRREEIATSAYSHIKRKYNLKNHIKEWENAYKSLTQD